MPLSSKDDAEKRGTAVPDEETKEEAETRRAAEEAEEKKKAEAEKAAAEKEAAEAAKEAELAQQKKDDLQKEIIWVDPKKEAKFGLRDIKTKVGSVARFLKNKMDPGTPENPNPDYDEEAASSRGLQVTLVVCSYLEKFFGYTFTAADFMNFIDAVHPEKSFERDDLKKLKKLRAERNDTNDELLRKYANTKNELKELGIGADKEDMRKELEKTLVDIKDQLKKNGVEDPDGRIDAEKKAVAEEVIKKMKGDNLDAQLSAFYVYRQLGELEGTSDEANLLTKSYDPEVLYAQLLHAKYDVVEFDEEKKNDPEYNGEGKRYSLFTHITSASKFTERANSGTLPTGTVVFFETYSENGQKMLITGIVGCDGIIKYHTRSGVHEMKAGVEDAQLHQKAGGILDAMGKAFKDDKDLALSPDYTPHESGEEVDMDALDLNHLLGGNPFFPSLAFKGAFLPEEEELVGEYEGKKEEEVSEDEKKEDKEEEKPEDTQEVVKYDKKDLSVTVQKRLGQGTSETPYRYLETKVTDKGKTFIVANGGRPGVIGSPKSSLRVETAKSQLKELYDRGIEIIVCLDNSTVVDNTKKALAELSNEGIEMGFEEFGYRCSEPYDRNVKIFKRLGKLINNNKAFYVHCKHGTHRAPSACAGGWIESGQVDSLAEALQKANLSPKDFKTSGRMGMIRQLMQYARSKGLHVETPEEYAKYSSSDNNRNMYSKIYKTLV